MNKNPSGIAIILNKYIKKYIGIVAIAGLAALHADDRQPE
jgi:hypothetical protein